MHRRILDALKHTGNLPSRTGLGLSILRLTQHDDFVLGQLARTIQSDPALTGRILELANANITAPEKAISSVEEAVLQLSIGTVRSVALGFTLVSSDRAGEGRGFDYDAYWSGSLIHAVCARHLASERGDIAPATAFTAALLSGIGRLAFAATHPEEYAGVLETTEGQSSKEILEAERRELGLDHSELAAALLRDWNLPEDVIHAVRSFELDPVRLQAPNPGALALEHVLRGAQRLAAAFQSGAGFRSPAWGQGSGETAFISREVALEPAALLRLRDRIVSEWQEWSQILEVPAATPAQEALSDTAAMRPSQPGSRRGLRILAVDDDPVTLKLLRHHLSRDGHSVRVARDGAEALALALEARPQMIVTDLSMPEMDGLELCRALRGSNVCSDAYVLVVTGHGEESRIVEAFEAGVDEFVNKPFNPNILLARVRAGQRMIELREHIELDKQELNRQNAQMSILNRKLKLAAMTDVLTELPNRRHAMRRLEEELASSQRTGSPLSVILLDIDHFKSVNDSHGHDVGDIVLRETAAVLRGCTRRNEEVCRLGGEEFLVIVPDATRETCAGFAERLRASVEAMEIRIGTYVGRVTVSLGVASLEDGVNTVDGLIKLADRRAYAAKATGRNCVVSSGEGDGRAQSA